MKVVIIEFSEVRELIQLIKSFTTRFFDEDPTGASQKTKVPAIIKELLEAYMGVEEPEDPAVKDLISMEEISLLMDNIIGSTAVSHLINFDKLAAVSLLDSRGSIAFLIRST